MLQAIVGDDDVNTIFDEHLAGSHTIRVDNDGATRATGQQDGLVADDCRVAVRFDPHRRA